MQAEDGTMTTVWSIVSQHPPSSSGSGYPPGLAQTGRVPTSMSNSSVPTR